MPATSAKSNKSLKRKTMSVSFHDLNPTVQAEIVKQCGFNNSFDLAQGVFKAKLSFTWDVEFPMKEADLDDLAAAMEDISVEDEPAPPKKKMMVKKAKSKINVEEETLDSSFIDVEDEFDVKYPDGLFFKYGSQTLWLSFGENLIQDVIDTSVYTAAIPHSYLKDCSDIQSALLINKKGQIVNEPFAKVQMSGLIKAKYMDDGCKMLVLSVNDSIKENETFNFMMNILCKAFADQVPKKWKVFFGKMEDGKWGMPNSDKMIHMLEKFGFDMA
jgi:hypothetical protein